MAPLELLAQHQPECAPGQEHVGLIPTRAKLDYNILRRDGRNKCKASRIQRVSGRSLDITRKSAARWEALAMIFCICGYHRRSEDKMMPRCLWVVVVSTRSPSRVIVNVEAVTAGRPIGMTMVFAGLNLPRHSVAKDAADEMAV